MAIPEDNATLYSDLENATAVSSPAIGPAGTIIGGAGFGTGWVGNGLVIDTVGEGLSFPYVTILSNLNIWIIKCKFKPNFNVVNGRADNGQNNCIFASDLNAPGKDGIEFFIRDHATYKTQIVIYHNNRASIVQTFFGVGNMTSGTWYDIMMVIDNTASFSGSSTMSYYLEGLEQASWTSPFTMLSQGAIHFGKHPYSTTFEANGIFDETKVFNTANPTLLAAIIANIPNEGFPSSLKRIIANKYNFYTHRRAL